MADRLVLRLYNAQQGYQAIKDGMNGIAWLDDSQVVSLVDCRKVYAEQPGVDVIMAGLEVAHA